MSTPQKKREFVWDVLEGTDPRKAMKLWCDPTYMDLVRVMPGVAALEPSARLANCCIVDFDPCFVQDEVQAAIEAIITG